MRPRQLLAVAVLAVAGAVCAAWAPPLAGSEPSGAAEETFTDPADDNPGGVAPDITKITVGMAADGVISIRIDTPNRTSLFQTDAVVMYMNTDLSGATGQAGSEYRIEAFGGGGGVALSHWSGSAWEAANAPSFTGSFDHGISARVNRQDLGGTAAFAFFAVTYSDNRNSDWVPDDAPNGGRLTAHLTGATPPPTTTQAPVTGSSFTRLVQRVKSGVLTLDVTTCSGGTRGTGILLGPRLVATVEHVVAGGRTVSVKRDGKVLATATVVGRDATRDLALLRTSKPIAGNDFRLARRSANLGEAVAVLGYPVRLPLSVTRGSVSGLNRTIRIGKVRRTRLIQTDAAVNDGNSGGPLLSVETEEVIGIVDIGSPDYNGIAFAVPSNLARPLLDRWASSPKPAAPRRCTH